MTEKTSSVPGSASQRLVPRDWREFQHYRDRKPPWIKLHRELLNDPVFMGLPLSAKGFATMLWLLACETEEGEIDARPEYLAFRLRMPPREVVDQLNHLVASGLFIVASNMLADASSLQATATGSVSVSVSPSASVPDDANPRLSRETLVDRFEELWQIYGRRDEKKAALAAYLELKPDIDLCAEIQVMAHSYVARKPEPQFRKHLHRWLKGRCWLDELDAMKNGNHTTNGRAM